MEMRDAIEADAEAIAALTDAPRDVMRNLVHDRTVRVVERDGEVCGFVSYDAREETVYITQIEGDEEGIPTLLEEPLGFARSEAMAVELLVPEGGEVVQTAAREAGFQETGRGPTFDGVSTRRFRLDEP